MDGFTILITDVVYVRRTTSYVRAFLKFESSRKRFDIHLLTINYDGYITSVFCPVFLFLQRNPRIEEYIDTASSYYV